MFIASQFVDHMLARGYRKRCCIRHPKNLLVEALSP
jgi:hypothetical protein